MTRKQALCQYLLAGGRLSILNGYRLFGISNISREVRRLVEQPFGVTLTRKKMEGKTKYGSYCTWLEYSLSHTKINSKGIKSMKDELTKKDSKKVVKMKAKA
jgi:hypothetical protein